MIKKVILNNFQLFKSAEFSPEKITYVSGVNLDTQDKSSNGSGKSTIAKNSIIFALYGDVPGLNLRDLIRSGASEASVEVQIEKDNNRFRIVRKIPSELFIYLNDNEVVANTATLKQKFIDEQFGDYEYFKKYRMIDTRGINLLDLGITSLRKALMEFIDDMFIDIRKRLQSKKLERETFNVDKRFYTFSLSEKRLQTLEEGIKSVAEDHKKNSLDKMGMEGVVNVVKSEIQSRERIIAYKKQEIKKLNGGICPLFNKTCGTLEESLEQVEENARIEIVNIENEIKNWKLQLDNEMSCLSYYNDMLKYLEEKEHRAHSYLMKLKEAFKFKEYKYTAKDVMLYAEAIKALDGFAGYYISEWLAQLSVIINDLLRPLNMSVEFMSEKDFIKIKNGDVELKYDQLSSGQKTFLSAVFKLAILTHKGENEGIIIADEGLSNLDFANLKNFIELCKIQNFQVIIIYQNLQNVSDVKQISVTRKDGESRVNA